ncbi:MAG: phosphatidate cytidylyltransferase [Ignavibacteria bacterium]|nr:phosphatidate cytidylyltransferase [Ignavibacteria bacterium]
MTNMVKRILVGLVGIPATVAFIFSHQLAFSALVIPLTTLALLEFYKLAESKHAVPNKFLGIAGSIVLQILFLMYTVSTPATAASILVYLTVAAIGFVLLTLASEMFRAQENALLNTSLTVFGVAYVTVCLSMLMMIRSNVNVSGFDGASLTMTLFAGVWMCDSAAYFAGLAFGKHKLFPRVSPEKTWEGAIGGGLAAIAIVIGMFAWLMPDVELIHALAIGLIIAVFGPIGDLAESWLKRDAVVKDSSRIIPGHGGILDRFDSMLFVAPIVVIYLVINFYRA